MRWGQRCRADLAAGAPPHERPERRAVRPQDAPSRSVMDGSLPPVVSGSQMTVLPLTAIAQEGPSARPSRSGCSPLVQGMGLPRARPHVGSGPPAHSSPCHVSSGSQQGFDRVPLTVLHGPRTVGGPSRRRGCTGLFPVTRNRVLFPISVGLEGAGGAARSICSHRDGSVALSRF